MTNNNKSSVRRKNHEEMKMGWKNVVLDKIEELEKAVKFRKEKYGKGTDETSKHIRYQAEGYLHAFNEVKGEVNQLTWYSKEEKCTNCGIRKISKTNRDVGMCKKCLDWFND